MPQNVWRTMTTFALLPLPEGGGALSSSYIARSPFWLKNVRFLFPSSFPSLRSFLAVTFSQLTPPMSKSFDPGFLVLLEKTKVETDKVVGNRQFRKCLLDEDVLGTETFVSLASSEDKVVAQITEAVETAIGKIPTQDAHGQLATGWRSSRSAVVRGDRVSTVFEDGKPFPATQSLVEHRPKCQCLCDCARRPARGNRWRCTSHCEAMVCQFCVGEWNPLICHYCLNPHY